MINIKNQIPNIYYDASRDFQILGHLYEVVLNYAKTNADMLYYLPNGIEEDTRTTELLATTLGFKLRRNYDKVQLAALVSIFPQLLKIKGTLRAINLAGNALVKASGVPGEFSSEIKDHVLTIKIPIELSDITLFIDLLPYILPFGLRVSIVRTTVIKQIAKTDIPTAVVMRKAFPGKERDGLHPLGLTNTIKTAKFAKYVTNKDNKPIEDENGNVVMVHALEVAYSDSHFIDPETKEPIAGQLGATPIIALNLPERSSSRDIQTTTEEENN